MHKLIVLAAVAVLLSFPAYAVTIKQDMPSCLTEEMFLQLAQAVIDKDMEALNWLGNNGCGVSQKPTHVSVIGTDGAMAHVRAYRGKIAVEIWTPIEALSGYNP